MSGNAGLAGGQSLVDHVGKTPLGLAHGFLRLGEPAGEFDERIVAHVRFVEAGAGVFAAEIGDGHAL